MESVELRVDSVDELDALLRALTYRRNLLSYKLEQLSGQIEIGPAVALTKVDEQARQEVIGEIELVDQLLGRVNWDEAGATWSVAS